MKQLLKRWLRRLVARTLHFSGLRRCFRSSRSGVPVLMFHNVGHPPETDYLPGHMKIGEAKLARLLQLLKRSGYSTATVGSMVAAFESGQTPRDRVVLTFDDGYRDNHDRLLPLLAAQGATATIYVQTGPMKGRLNWLHHYFWVLHAKGPHALGEQLAAQVERSHLQTELRALPADPVAAEYQLKRLLKYEISAADRDRLLDEAFRGIGGDEAALARQVYLGPEECRALDRAGVEIGAHTVDHLVLSSLDKDQQRREIEGSIQDLQSWLGKPVESFAYPYGRSWDYNADTLAILRDLGVRSAITAMPGFNDPQTERLELRRFAVTEASDLAEVLCEVDGVFDWLDRRGVRLRG
ncbi:MAG: polysaccharide deacetylase family protein [Planctomycetota bacterium]